MTFVCSSPEINRKNLHVCDKSKRKLDDDPFFALQLLFGTKNTALCLILYKLGKKSGTKFHNDILHFFGDF